MSQVELPTDELSNVNKDIERKINEKLDQLYSAFQLETFNQDTVTNTLAPIHQEAMLLAEKLPHDYSDVTTKLQDAKYLIIESKGLATTLAVTLAILPVLQDEIQMLETEGFQFELAEPHQVEFVFEQALSIGDRMKQLNIDSMKESVTNFTIAAEYSSSVVKILTTGLILNILPLVNRVQKSINCVAGSCNVYFLYRKWLAATTMYQSLDLLDRNQYNVAAKLVKEVSLLLEQMLEFTDDLVCLPESWISKTEELELNFSEFTLAYNYKENLPCSKGVRSFHDFDQLRSTKCQDFLRSLVKSQMEATLPTESNVDCEKENSDEFAMLDLLEPAYDLSWQEISIETATNEVTTSDWQSVNHLLNECGNTTAAIVKAGADLTGHGTRQESAKQTLDQQVNQVIRSLPLPCVLKIGRRTSIRKGQRWTAASYRQKSESLSAWYTVQRGDGQQKEILCCQRQDRVQTQIDGVKGQSVLDEDPCLWQDLSTFLRLWAICPIVPGELEMGMHTRHHALSERTDSMSNATTTIRAKQESVATHAGRPKSGPFTFHEPQTCS